MIAEVSKAHAAAPVASPRFLAAVLAFSTGMAEVVSRPFTLAHQRSTTGGSQANESGDHAYWASIARGF